MPHFRIALPLAVALSAIVAPGLAAGLDWVRVAPDGRSSVCQRTGERLVPWGFNYDHDAAGRLLEDYWDREWAAVADDFREMRKLAVHLYPEQGKVDEAMALQTQGAAALARPIECQGTYPHHLQGVCTNNQDAVYWSFTTTLVKTDAAGKVLKKIAVENHHGDLCFHNGNVYVAVNLGAFNDPKGKANSWVYVYDAGDLSLVARHETQEVFYGAGGIGCRGERFFVVGGLPDGVQENYVYEYDKDFKFVGRRVIKSGWTLKGIQTAAFSGGHWWFGCYGDPQVTLKTDESFRLLGRYAFDCSLGVVALPNGDFLVARGSCQPGAGCRGSVVPARADDEKGLAINEAAKKAATGDGERLRK